VLLLVFRCVSKLDVTLRGIRIVCIARHDLLILLQVEILGALLAEFVQLDLSLDLLNVSLLLSDSLEWTFCTLGLKMELGREVAHGLLFEDLVALTHHFNAMLQLDALLVDQGLLEEGQELEAVARFIIGRRGRRPFRVRGRFNALHGGSLCVLLVLVLYLFLNHDHMLQELFVLSLLLRLNWSAADIAGVQLLQFMERLLEEFSEALIVLELT
jgi:hypothetical protein